jgi:hypothetical protein
MFLRKQPAAIVRSNNAIRGSVLDAEQQRGEVVVQSFLAGRISEPMQVQGSF